jgi:hypothetical protein
MMMIPRGRRGDPIVEGRQAGRGVTCLLVQLVAGTVVAQQPRDSGVDLAELVEQLRVHHQQRDVLLVDDDGSL